MLEYWMASNETGRNVSDAAIEGLLLNPGSAALFEDYPRWLLHFAAGCCVLFMVIGIPGNLFTVAALFLTKKLRNATAIFIMNLSISDLMFCCFNLPLAASTFWHRSWRHGALLCRLFPLLRYGLVAVSLFTILAITINRYVMISHPRLYPKIYKRKYLIPMVLGTWIIAFSILIVTWFGQWGRFGLDPAIGSCSILPDVNGRSPKEFLFVVAFLTPCICIVVSYARIFYIVRKTASRTRKQNTVSTTDITERCSTSPNMKEEFSNGNKDSLICPKSTIQESSFSDPSSLGLEQLKESKLEEEEIEVEKEGEKELEEENEGEKELEEEKEEEEEDGEIEEELNENERRNDEPVDDDIIEKTGLVIKIDDIPFADEREASDIEDSNTFFKNDESKSKDIVEKSSSARRKLERMASRASFIVESAFGIQKGTPTDTQEAGNPEKLVASASASRPFQKKQKVYRRESRLKSIRRLRALETPPRMSSKDKKLLKMILVIFSSFLICYLPITVTKIFKNAIDWRGLNIAGYILIYLTTCINPVVYVVMSSEYRSAYKNVLLCRSDPVTINNRKKSLR